MAEIRFPQSYFIPGNLKESYESVASGLRERGIVQRIWDRDPTVWASDPTEIENRLGWLDLPAQSPKAISSVKESVVNHLEDGFQDVVLLGMGGSSLCPLVFSRILGSSDGYPRFHVLDSTSPSWVKRTSNSVTPKKSLFIVSSKSGGTIEVMSGFKFFWERVSKAVEKPGNHFFAITDPETSLEALAKERGFAKIFTNPTDIGGRFSALSYFGMVPALLMGLETEEILGVAREMAEDCREADIEKNPGAQLGVFMAAAAAEGRDKLTILTSPGLGSLGLWIEQLIAESTGKEGKGILPVAEEPLVGVSRYERDRAFAAILTPDDLSLNETLEALKGAGHPVAVFELVEGLDLGAEFFRWEFATAVASHFLGIHPFNQPDVQAAKTASSAAIESYNTTGSLPSAEPSPSLPEILSDVQPGSYFAIMAYLDESAAVEDAVNELRTAVLKKHGIATTFGYGPRFLHSTGQYHKGGPNTGLFLQLVREEDEPLPIPGEAYDYSILCQAQALGDHRALVENGRRVARVSLGTDVAAGIRELADQAG